jgi:probable rRNA maturation factor
MKLVCKNSTNLKLDIDFNKIAKKIFNKLSKSDNLEIGLHIVDDKRITELNLKYRRKNCATDVICFPLDHPEKKGAEPKLLGDIFISLETAAQNAKAYGLSTEVEVEKLFKHGLLHLLGFDHEKDKDDWEKAIKKISAKGGSASGGEN